MNKSEALKLLKELDAPERLITHVLLVGEAAKKLLQALESLHVELDRNLVEVGVILHDVGKIIYPQELHQKGSYHEAAGQRILVEQGIEERIARVCVSHSQWQNESSFEESLIALADKLWKGKRVRELEEKVIKAAAKKIDAEYWDVFIRLDACFEEIANLGEERLSRSIVSDI